MNKKAVIIILAAVLVLTSVFTAFSFLNKDKNSEIDSLDEELKFGNLDQANLTFMFKGFPGQNKTFMREALNELEKKVKSELNIKLDFKWSNNWYADTVNYVNSGSDADVYGVDLNDKEALKQLLEKGKITDVSEAFKAYAPNYYSKFTPEELNAGKIEGNLVAIPNHIMDLNKRSVAIREDLVSKYNISDVNTIDDVERILQQIKQGETGLLPLALTDDSIHTFSEENGYVVLDYSLQLLYKWDDPNMKIVAWEQTPEYEKTIRRLNSWKQKEYFPKGINSYMMSDQIFSKGKYGVVLGEYGSEPQFNSWLKVASVDKIKYKEFMLYPEQPIRKGISYSGIAFNAASKNIDRAIMFVEWIQSKQENYDLLMYGIEGKNYVLNKDQIDVPGNMKINGIWYAQPASFSDWLGREALINYERERIDAVVSSDYIKKYTENFQNAKYSPDTGFVPDLTPVKEIATTRSAAILVMEQNIQGGYTDSEITNYIENQKSVGVDALVNELQKQLNEWIKTEN